MHDTLSPLAVDIAVSQVSLAAMNAKAGIKPESEALDSARDLLEVLKGELNVDKDVSLFSSEIVPDEQLRKMLQRALPERSRKRESRFPQADNSRLQQIIQLLEFLVKNKNLPPEKAEDLQVSLFSLSPRVLRLQNNLPISSQGESCSDLREALKSYRQAR